jgi:endogenous inhibitor of DNA gyrase (YacG/DUF329 family)
MTPPMNAENDNDRLVDPPKPCRICGKPALVRFKPFCSKRCADIDLNRWLKGAYAIPVVENEGEDEDEPGRG